MAESEERELQALIVLRSDQRHIGKRCNGRGWWPKIRQAEPSQRRQGERGPAGGQLLPLHQGLRLQNPHCTLIPRCLIGKEKKSERLRLSVEEECVYLKVTFLPWMGKITRKWRPVLHLRGNWSYGMWPFIENPHVCPTHGELNWRHLCVQS